MRTQAATAARRATYEGALERALPAILAARVTGCTTGTHIRDFLNAVGVRAPNGGGWTVNSANRAVRQLISSDQLKWNHRHRGRRNPALEGRRIVRSAKAIDACREMYAATARSIASGLHPAAEGEVSADNDTIQNQPVAVTK